MPTDCPRACFSRRLQTVEENRFSGSTIGEGSGEGEALPSEREEEQALWAAPLGARPENAAMTNENRISLLIHPTRGAQLPKRGRAKLSVPPPWLAREASIRELKLDERREAPGTENLQWRKKPACWLLTIGRGSGRGNASPSGERPFRAERLQGSRRCGIPEELHGRCHSLLWYRDRQTTIASR